MNERQITLQQKEVNLYFFDGTEVRKREGTIAFVDESNYLLENRGLLEIFPKDRIVRIEVFENDRQNLH